MGDKNPSGKIKCQQCFGSGIVTEKYEDEEGGASRKIVTKSRTVTCPTCGGNGFI